MAGVYLKAGLAAAAAAALASIGWACSDGGEGTSWDPESSSGILSPGNDTRSNFILLMADRYDTKVADPSEMKGIVPFDFPYRVMLARLYQASAQESEDSYREEIAGYGLSENNRYFGYDSGNLGLCHTNRNGASQLEGALNSDPSVPASEKTQLVAARSEIAKACDKAGTMTLELSGVTSPAGRAYAHYVEGTRLFYAEMLTDADREFGAVGKAASSWLTETAAYMRFRAALATAAKGSIGEWGEIAEPAKRDLLAIDRADSQRRQYLAAYPQGRYALSARDLERRIAWLRGDKATLGTAYSMMLGKRAAAGGLPDIATMEEVDRRILPSNNAAGLTDPTLLAVIDLMRLRPNDEKYDKERGCCGNWLGRPELEGQRRYFQSQPDLFGFLEAAEAYYHLHQPSEVLSLIPDASHQSRFSYVQFSRQMLRGFALEAVGDRNARGFWSSLLPGAVQPYQREAVELAILQHDQKAGVVGRLLETGSPILHPLIRQKIIEDDAGPDILRQQATSGKTTQQREVALYLLLANELHHGRYREFLSDQALVGNRPQPRENEYNESWSVADYDPTYRTDLGPPPLYVFAAGGSDDLKACPDIRATATNLAADPAAIRPRLCLSEFIRRKGFDGWGEQYDDTLGKTVAHARNGFAGKPLERMETYQAVLASPLASSDDKAFALNRAIRCYQPAGYSSCGGEQVGKSVRKAWFDRLRSQYPGSPWAKELKYYW